MNTRHVPLVVATRGEIVESVHYGSIAVVAGDGAMVKHAGDAEAMTFIRSAAKPIQVLPLLSHPRVGDYGFTLQDIALMCASHSGEPSHVNGVKALLAKTGGEVSQLRCGVHVPLFYEATDEQPPPGEPFSPLQHMCSGKHAGMLALARLLGTPPEDYLDPRLAVQSAVVEAISALAGVPQTTIGVGLDGCSAPSFAVPLSALALAYARLGSAQGTAPDDKLLQQIYTAIATHPDLVSGSQRPDRLLTEAGAGAWITKVGAEGVHAMAIRSRNWGVAIKIADGAARALPVVAVEVLRQLMLLLSPLSKPLTDLACPAFMNCSGIKTGVLRPVFSLD